MFSSKTDRLPARSPGPRLVREGLRKANSSHFFTSPKECFSFSKLEPSEAHQMLISCSRMLPKQRSSNWEDGSFGWECFIVVFFFGLVV